ncbi:MAG TPA: VirB3 family type IV secretion system protein [Gemmatimonadaceae bacterium]|jgi:type IV secretory pathway TrbD component|nr:VirB3 family type IV secretion system protein [Gemmatimonadaceae bacterium]
MEPELQAIHPSLYRPVLFAGVEPAVAIAEASIVLALVVVVGVHLATIALAVVYATAVHAVTVAVTRDDPLISVVYLRSIAARDYYPPHARLTSPAPRVRPAIP